MARKDELESLHGHFVKCSEIFELVKVGIDKSDFDAIGFTEEFKPLLDSWCRFNRLAVAYGLLYVVIEGYRELKLENKAIDELLEKTDYVEKLRLLRNAMFHFQKHRFPKKFWNFILISDSEKWTKKLKNAFGKYFSTELNIENLIKRFKKNSQDLKDD